MVDCGDPLLRGWDWPYVPSTAPRRAHPFSSRRAFTDSEYVSIDAVIRSGASLDPAQVSGRIVLCLPLINAAALLSARPIVSPIDNLNMKPHFPRQGEGHVSAQRLAYQLVRSAPCATPTPSLDMHGGDVPRHSFPSTLPRDGQCGVDCKKPRPLRGFPVRRR